MFVYRNSHVLLTAIHTSFSRLGGFGLLKRRRLFPGRVPSGARGPRGELRQRRALYPRLLCYGGEPEPFKATTQLHLNLWKRPGFHIDVCKPRGRKQRCFQVGNTSRSQAGRDWAREGEVLLASYETWKTPPEEYSDTW